MSRTTNAAWDPTLRSRFNKFMAVSAAGHGWHPMAKRFTRLLERAIAEKRRDAKAKEASAS